MSLTYDLNTHTHFNAPTATGEHAELLNTPDKIILVVGPPEAMRVWFIGSYLYNKIDGVIQESPFDALGACVMSYPVEGCNFFTEKEAEGVEAMISVDLKTLRQASG